MSVSVSFGDNVRIVRTAETTRAGIADRVGCVYGVTTPSITNVDVIGELTSDCAVNVHIDELNEAFWLPPELVEFVGHAPGTEVWVQGSPTKSVRQPDGTWLEVRIKQDLPPFVRIRARFLISWLIVAAILSWVPVFIAWPEFLDNPDLDDPTPWAVGGLLFSVLIFAVPALRARRAGLAISDLYSSFVVRSRLPQLAVLALPMVGVAFIGIYVLYAPLSLAFPEATYVWLFENRPVLYSAGPPYPFFGNAIGLLSIVVAVPIAEEWFFRGLLLRRWSHRWGPARAVVVSSLAFSLGHTDILGSFVFGLFMCALFARYRSLWAPTIVHAANNALVWFLSVLDSHIAIFGEFNSVAQLRGAWWLPALGLLLALPWALRVRGQYGSISSWDFTTPPNKAVLEE